jgi:Protein of unknown function (DUF2934)
MGRSIPVIESSFSQKGPWQLWQGGKAMPLTGELRERVLSNETVRAWISKRAYELHQLGGYEPGRATEDWRNAESELLALASLFEEVLRSRSTIARQAMDKRRDEKISPKPRRTRSASALPFEAPPITDKNLDQDSPAKPKQEVTKKRKPR